MPSPEELAREKIDLEADNVLGPTYKAFGERLWPAYGRTQPYPLPVKEKPHEKAIWQTLSAESGAGVRATLSLESDPVKS